MRHFTLFFLVLLSSFICRAQNLLSNGDFEAYTTCPTNAGQTNSCTGWSSYTSTSPDYFNACNTTNVSVPSNVFGYQQPASGNAYMGLVAIHSSSTFREYVKTAIPPLIIGRSYEISMSIVLAEYGGHFGVDGLGVYFFQNGLSATGNANPVVLTPQVSFASYGPLSDTQNWLRVTKTFIADSSYTNMVIGCFADNNNIIKYPNNISGFSYYFIDSVVLKTDTHISINFADSLLCAGDIISVPYTIVNSILFGSNNIFSLQLSDVTGSFASPVTIGTLAGSTAGTITGLIPTVPPGTGYRIRITSSNPVDSSNISLKPISIGAVKPAKPVITVTNPCEGQVLNLNAASTTPGVSYRWNGPNAFTSTQQNPAISNVTTAASGDYIVTTWLYGCNARDTETVVIKPMPVAITAGSNSPVCEGSALNLTSTNSTTGATYSWTGPNSFTANTQNPTISSIPIAGNGTYTVTADLNGCTTSNTTAVVVKPLPANFSATSNSPVCTTKPINLFGNTTSGGVTFSWVGPGAYSNTSQNPGIATAITANAGDYILTATLNGCSIKDTATVIVNESPAGAVVASANTPVCQNTPLNLTATGSLTGSVYSWSGPSFTSGAQNPDINNVQPSAAGDYIVALSLNGCTVKDTVTVVVLIAPTNVNATSNTPICAGQTLTLDVTNSTPGVSYTWSGPSFVANSQSASINSATPAASGDYIASLSINGCIVKDTVSVVVNPIPTTPTASSNTPVCQGNPINLYATASLPGAIYNWSGPSYTSNQQNPVIPNANTAMTGTYSVNATLNGCTSPTTTTNVNVLYYPSSVNLYVLPNDTICVGGSIQLVAVPSNGGAVPQYKWLKNGFPISGATSISYNATSVINKDKYRVILTPDNSCPDPDTSAPLEITVLPYVKPEVSITATPGTIISPWQTITFHATPINGGANPTYQWKRNGQDVVGAVNDTWGAYTLGDNDVISVVLYSSEICPSPATATSNTISITVKLGVDDVKENTDDFVLYPNPNNGNFTLKGKIATNEPVAIEIWNAIGQLVHREMLSPAKGMLNTGITMDKNLSAGVYILKLQTTNDSKPLRFTISK